MEEVDQASGIATAGVQAMAAAAEELAYSIEEISARVNEASRTAEAASDNARRTDRIVQSLFEASSRIGTVVTFIQTIAGQTRLLALNATIEAARAGEHGHGFTVVANEVKQLADKTTQATDEIASQIAAVQSAGRAAVEAIREIADSVESVTRISGSIAAAVEEQGAATKEIARSAQEAAQGTTHVAASINWVSQEASGMRGSTAAMLDTSLRMTRQSETLRATVDNFLLGVQDGAPSLKWGEAWLTGNAEIDRDHEVLVGTINELSAAMMQARGPDVIGSVLDKLADYAGRHFAREERIWEDGGLPSIDTHRHSHQALLAEVGKLTEEFRRGRVEMSVELLSFLRQWLVNHVFKSDKAAVAALAARC
jgi:methyl-accepting chemotaxis protein